MVLGELIMKKRILLTALLVMLLACLFVLCASAVAYDADRTVVEYTDASGVTHEVPVVKYDVEPSIVNDAIKLDTKREHNCDLKGLTAMADDSALCIVKDTSGNLTAYPTWYLIDATGTAIYEVSYGYLNKVSGKTYNEGAIVYVEFPQGMSYVRNNGVFGQKGNSSQYEKNATEIYIPNTVTKIEGSSLSKMTELKYVYLQDNPQLSVIADEAVSESKKLVHFDFGKLTLLTEIDGFRECTSLTGDVDLSKCTSLKTIGGTTFYNTDIRAITLPDSVESIGDKAFAYCKNAYLTSSYLPASLKSIGVWFFSYNDCLLDTYIFPAGVTQLPSEPFQDSKVAGGPTGKELNLIFLGKLTGVVYLNGNGHQKHAEKVTVYFAQNSLSDYNKDGFYIKPSGSSVTSVPGAIRAAFCKGTGSGTNGNVTGIEYVYITSTSGSSYTADMVNDAENGFDYDNHRHFGAKLSTLPTCGTEGFSGTACIVCDQNIGTTVPATGNHTVEDDGDCTTEALCSACQNVVIEALSHVLGEIYTYEKGFTATGIYKNGCTNEGCTHGETTEIPALVTSKGYSQDTTSMAVVLGLTFNKNAIEAYGNYLGKDIYYGLVASKTQSDLCPLKSNGEAKENSVKADFTGKDYSIFQLKITGIDKKDDYFHCCGYLVIGEEVSYVNASEVSKTALEVSYNNYTGKKES